MVPVLVIQMGKGVQGLKALNLKSTFTVSEAILHKAGRIAGGLRFQSALATC